MLDVIIGLEIHAELKTKSKMFCRCDNDAYGKAPNTTVCPVCLGHPGTLPVPNREAIASTILIGLALNCKINELSKFDRKNYFYPDLPKGYQISQYDLPFCYDGHLEISGDRILITRVHLEEDTGKLTHPAGKGESLVDFNRAGTPLVEMVTEPVIKSAAAAKKFCKAYQQILRYLDLSNADMEKGEMRCEANISLQSPGSWAYEGKGHIAAKDGRELNAKVEVKNINSFRALEKAIDYEIKRQTEALKNGEKITQETRGWDEDKNETFSQRTKETAADYRYFPEPDIPPIKISPEWLDEIRTRLIELPPKKIKRFQEEYALDEAAAEIIASDRGLAEFFENAISELRAWVDSTGDSWETQKAALSRILVNWIISELFKHLKNDNKNISDIRITAENFAELVCLIHQEKINSSAGQSILEAMYKNGGDPTDIMRSLGLEQLDNNEELEKTCQEVIDKNPQQALQYKNGKENLLQFFVGQAMAATKGRANPKKLIGIFIKLLK